MDIKDLENTLTGLITSLKPVEFQPSEITDSECIILDGHQPDNSCWREIVAEKLTTARIFEIHCWRDETEEIQLALQHGAVKPFDWQHGTVIEGAVTPEFIDMLLQMPKPADTVFSSKMTPFFTITLDNGFSSAHYGTELILPVEKE